MSIQIKQLILSLLSDNLKLQNLKKSYSIFERIQRATLIFTLAVTSTFVLYLIWQIELSFNYIFVIELVAAILLFVFSLYFFVINEIPKTLPRKFDVLKNKIANQEIDTVERFSKELNEFIIKFFNFITFDINYSAVQINDHKIVYSGNEIQEIESTLTENIEKTKTQTSPIRLGKISINNKKHFGYIIPIHFGNNWLGYFVVFTKSRLNRIYVDFLDNFEDDYIDDQLIHVLRNHIK